MAEQLRHFYNARVVRDIATDLRRASRGFDADGFARAATRGLAPLSLTERAAHIARAMSRFLPDDFDAAADVLLRSMKRRQVDGEALGMASMKYLPYTIFVADHGLARARLAARRICSSTSTTLLDPL